MNFKMSGKDFELLAKYIAKRAEGVSLRFTMIQDSKLEVELTNNSNESVKIIIKSEDSNSFPDIVKTRRLGDEL